MHIFTQTAQRNTEYSSISVSHWVNSVVPLTFLIPKLVGPAAEDESRTSNRTHPTSTLHMFINHLKLCSKIFVVSSENQVKQKRTVWSKCRVYECYSRWYIYLPPGLKKLINLQSMHRRVGGAISCVCVTRRPPDSHGSLCK